MTSRRRWVAGDVYSVMLPDGSFGFFQLKIFPIAEFFSLRKSNDIFDFDVTKLEILFRVWIMKSTINRKLFSKIGHSLFDQENDGDLYQYRKDIINGNYYLMKGGYDLYEISSDEAQKLERAQVWSDVHIIDRISKNLNGEISYWQAFS